MLIYSFQIMFFMFLLLSMSLATLVVPSVRNVVIVGGGAAGLSSAIEALRKGANVTLLEKTPKIGGNSAKASSGISAAYTTVQQQHHISDSVHNFLEDTTKTGLELGDKEMVSTLVSNSAGAIDFLLNELKLPITELLQLGGHSAKRTHRLTTHAPIGFSLVKSLEKKVADMVANEEGGTFQLLSSATVIHLETADDHTVEVIYTNEGEELRLKADAVVMTSGGMSFGRDLLTEYAPHLVGHATSSGPQADGSGIRILRDLGAKLVDMDKVQVHPTGFVDPKNPASVSKILAPEALRGCGGILVNSAGNRFVDELTRRGVVTAFIEQYGDHSQPVLESGRPQATVSMILNQRVVDRFGQKLFNFYLGRGIFREYANIEELCEKESINHSALQNTLREYSQMATASDFGVNVDPFGKTVFPVPIDGTETLFVATITPVMHYNMGGIKITPNAEVIKHVENDDEDGTPSVISGLYAAGECTGGVHGGDRLAGNSLLDCVVFGRIAGMQAATSTTAVVKETESYNQEL